MNEHETTLFHALSWQLMQANIRVGYVVTLLLVGAIWAPSPAGAGNWIPLFDGQTLAGWTTPNGKPVETGWVAEQGVLHLDRSAGRGGDILTEAEFGDFELVFEWKNSARGNSGIKYRVRDFDGRVLGCEYQMIDDASFPDLRPEQMTASLYDVYAASSSKYVEPIDDYNRGRIVVCGNRIQHWLNGRLVVCAIVGSREWRQRISQSKFADVPGFGENRYGRIMLTDHNSDIWYRNVFIRDLSSAGSSYVRARPFGLLRRRPFHRLPRCR